MKITGTWNCCRISRHGLYPTRVIRQLNVSEDQTWAPFNSQCDGFFSGHGNACDLVPKIAYYGLDIQGDDWLVFYDHHLHTRLALKLLHSVIGVPLHAA